MTNTTIENYVPVSKGFELNNLQRRHLGLDEVQPHWDRMTMKDGTILYFDGDVIRKMICCCEGGPYQESDHHELTAEGRTMLLPKTKRGKPRKLNFTATNYFSYRGVYFSFWAEHIVIGNYTTQTSFYTENNSAKLTIEEWLKKWVEETTDRNLTELREFKEAKRVHQKYAEGDFFAFKVGRNKWGFGRIVLNIDERRKSESFAIANPGLNRLMGKPLYIGIYRKLSDVPEIDVDELRHCEMLPTQSIMDNHLYYGEYRIIGNRPMVADEWEPLISFESNNLYTVNPHSVYLQYGLICRQTDAWDDDRFLKNDKNNGQCKYGNSAIGFHIHHYSDLERIITEGIDNDELLWKNDLRKRSNIQAKRHIFRRFGLDADKSYAENLIHTSSHARGVEFC